MAVAGQSDTRQAVGLQIAFLAAAILGGVKWGGGLLGALGGAFVFTILQTALQQTALPVPLQEAGVGVLLVAAVGIGKLKT